MLSWAMLMLLVQEVETEDSAVDHEVNFLVARTMCLMPFITPYFGTVPFCWLGYCNSCCRRQQGLHRNSLVGPQVFFSFAQSLSQASEIVLHPTTPSTQMGGIQGHQAGESGSLPSSSCTFWSKSLGHHFCPQQLCIYRLGKDTKAADFSHHILGAPAVHWKFKFFTSSPSNMLPFTNPSMSGGSVLIFLRISHGKSLIRHL